MQEMVTALMVLGIVIGSFLFLGWMIWMVARARKDRQQNEIELRARMLDKFGTSDEFVGFMQTDAGKKFLDTASSRFAKSARNRVASSLSWGTILFLFGTAFCVFAWVENDTDFLIPGSLFAAVGIGLALSAYFYHRLAPDVSDNGS
jgi:hypothetical protein